MRAAIVALCVALAGCAHQGPAPKPTLPPEAVEELEEQWELGSEGTMTWVRKHGAWDYECLPETFTFHDPLSGRKVVEETQCPYSDESDDPKDFADHDRCDLLPDSKASQCYEILILRELRKRK